MLSRKTYVAIAAAIAGARESTRRICDPEDAELLGANNASRNICDQLSVFFAGDNPAFNAEEFRSACGF